MTRLYRAGEASRSSSACCLQLTRESRLPRACGPGMRSNDKQILCHWHDHIHGRGVWRSDDKVAQGHIPVRPCRRYRRAILYPAHLRHDAAFGRYTERASPASSAVHLWGCNGISRRRAWLDLPGSDNHTILLYLHHSGCVAVYLGLRP